MNGKNSNKKNENILALKLIIIFHFFFTSLPASLRNPHSYKTLWRRYHFEGGFGSDGITITETFLIPSHIRLSPFLIHTYIYIYMYTRHGRKLFIISPKITLTMNVCVCVCVLKTALFANGKLYLISNPSNVNVNFPSPSTTSPSYASSTSTSPSHYQRLSIVSSSFSSSFAFSHTNFHPQIFLISLFDAPFAYNRDIDNAHLTAWWYARDNDKKRLQYPS